MDAESKKPPSSAPADRTGAPFVFEADIEAGEVFFAQMARGCVVTGVLLGAIDLILSVITGGSAGLILGAGVIAVLGSLPAAAAGWVAAGWMIASIRRRAGVLAAFAATHYPMWTPRERDGPRALWRYYRGPPEPEDTPPGMTLEEYARGRARAKRLEWTVGVLFFLLLFAWMSLLAFGYWLRNWPTYHSTDWLVSGAFYVAFYLGTSAAWLLRWRRHRDEIARWAGALTMDDFMQTRGWQRRSWTGWRRAPEAGAGGDAGT
jgi:hypothetical protein